MRGQGYRLVRVVDARGFAVAGGSGPVQVVLLFQRGPVGREGAELAGEPRLGVFRAQSPLSPSGSCGPGGPPTVDTTAGLGSCRTPAAALRQQKCRRVLVVCPYGSATTGNWSAARLYQPQRKLRPSWSPAKLETSPCPFKSREAGQGREAATSSSAIQIRQSSLLALRARHKFLLHVQ